ncbi:MAG: ABC transporter ATP-binding protein, partial [Wenzhouxiangellaceae bacterium]|nr:ABC transporter ATP-binding protein [Wenzhouxiangellaceae bacterium]
GRIVEEGPAGRVLSAPAHPYTQALIDAAPRAEPGARRIRAPLAGEAASPAAPPPGCGFHPRCPRAMPGCGTIVPRTIRLQDGNVPHWVRCHLHDSEFEGGGSR